MTDHAPHRNGTTSWTKWTEEDWQKFLGPMDQQTDAETTEPPSRNQADEPAGGASAGNSKPPPKGSKDTTRILDTTCLNTLRPQPVRWLVPGYFPLGKLILLAGDGGHGKSFLTLDLTADLSTGRPAFGLEYTAAPPMDVLLISCEDDFEDTIVPRLHSAGADVDRIHRVNGVRTKDGLMPFTLAEYEAVESKLQAQPNIRAVVIDPAGAYIGNTGVDDYKDSALRSLLGPLSELAARRRVSIILVKHFIKGATTKAVHKVSGSAGYVNTVRAAFVVIPADGDESEQRKLFLPLKFNLGPHPSGLSYQLQKLDPAECNRVLSPFTHLEAEDQDLLAEQLYRVEWLGTVATTANEALSENGASPKKELKADQAETWLLAFLEKFAYPTEEIMDAATKQGFSRTTLYNVKAKLKKEQGKDALPARQYGGAWWWGIGDPAKWKRRPDDDAAIKERKEYEEYQASRETEMPLYP